MSIDNSYFVSCKDNHDCPVVEPYKGKHAVKTASFFDLIRKLQNKCMPLNWTYKPLKVEIELTNGCNESCPHCGMSAQPVSKSTSLSRDILLSLPSQLKALGIPGISITGGEPFTIQQKMLALLSECRGKVDVVKLTTNGYWADSLEAAKEKLILLADHGLMESRLFRPLLMLSIGEQTVPFKYIVNVIMAVQTLFKNETISLCISSLSLGSKNDNISNLECCYKKMTGKFFPWDNIFLTERSYISAGRGSIDPQLPQRAFPIEKMCKERGCFKQTIGSYVVPTPLIKANGDAYCCSVFGMPNELALGNLYNKSIKEILEEANTNLYIRVLTEGNLPALRKLAGPLDGNVVVDNFHEACWKLITAHKNKVL